MIFLVGLFVSAFLFLKALIRSKNGILWLGDPQQASDRLFHSQNGSKKACFGALATADSAFLQSLSAMYFLMLCASATKPNSMFTFSFDFRRKRLNPWLNLMLPKTASGSMGLLLRW